MKLARSSSWVAVAGLLLLSCSPTAPPAPLSEGCQRQLSELAAEDPVRKADLVFNSGTPYFLGVRGYSDTFPGVNDLAMVERIGFRIMEGTTDALRGQGCREFQLHAMEFAERFNLRIVALISER